MESVILAIVLVGAALGAMVMSIYYIANAK
jgi:hypothetical protein